ncbi:MAG: glycosyltransferase [Deltaproteobacteria bacterium]|nr:glycosyltransferase [Deltaproteobacteria bacterium]
MTPLEFIHKAIQRLSIIASTFPYNLMRYRLKKIYEKRPASITRTDHTIEPPNIEIIQLGQNLREDILRQYKNKYQFKSYRILFQVPPSGVGALWFNDLIQTLSHTGIQCASVQWSDPNFRQIWDAFHPDVFISFDIDEVLRSLDLDFINRYKKSDGCLRLFTPSNKHNFPKPGMPAKDEWRFELARIGQSADAYFCMFVEEFFSQFWSEWKNIGFQYLSLPHGCNPIYQYPRESAKDFDYFMATSYGPERVKLTWQYLKPILENYYGLWAGPNWGFGLGPLNSTQLPDLYAQARIVPNPLARFLIDYPSEITERAFSATACGAFQITDWTPVTERFYSPNELVTVRSRKEFIEKFDYYITHPEERNQIIKNGMQRVFKDHTYFHRIDHLVEFLDHNQQLFQSPFT